MQFFFKRACKQWKRTLTNISVCSGEGEASLNQPSKANEGLITCKRDEDASSLKTALTGSNERPSLFLKGPITCIGLEAVGCAMDFGLTGAGALNLLLTLVALESGLLNPGLVADAFPGAFRDCFSVLLFWEILSFGRTEAPSMIVSCCCQ
jgi:hypothetical protein